MDDEDEEMCYDARPSYAVVVVKDATVRQRLLDSTYESADEGTLPVVHTCTHEFHLPPWESKPVVAARLHTVLEHAGDGFQTN